MNSNTLRTAIEKALASKHTRRLAGRDLAMAVAEIVGADATFDDSTMEFVGTALVLDLTTRTVR